MNVLQEPRVVEPASALPSGRIPYARLRPDLLLHSFVEGAAWDELATTGVLVAREHHAMRDPVDEFAYRWMAEQVRARLGAADDVWPLWAWARTTRAELIRTARRCASRDAGTVLVTFVAPASRVLVSGYADWHSPLNRVPLWPLDVELEDVEGVIDAWYDHADVVAPGNRQTSPHSWPSALRDEMLATWPAVFDATRWSRRAHLQACLAEIRADDVLDAVRPSTGAGLRQGGRRAGASRAASRGG